MAKIELNNRWQVDWIRDAKNSLSLRYGVYNLSEKTDRFVIFVSGRTEYIEKYHYAFDDLNLPENCALLTWDHRGQGDSGGARGFVESYDVFVSDAKEIINHVVGEKPYVIFSHSMGSLVSLYGTIHGEFTPQKLLLLSPLLGLPNNPVHTLLSRPISAAISQLKMGPIDIGKVRNHFLPFSDNKLTFSSKRFAHINQQPYHIPAATYGWIHASFLAIDEVFDKNNLMKLKPDIMMLGGTDDILVNSDRWLEWIQLASGLCQGSIVFEWVHEAKHELLLELPQTYQKVMRKIIDFLNFSA